MATTTAKGFLILAIAVAASCDDSFQGLVQPGQLCQSIVSQDRSSLIRFDLSQSAFTAPFYYIELALRNSVLYPSKITVDTSGAGSICCSTYGEPATGCSGAHTCPGGFIQVNDDSSLTILPSLLSNVSLAGAAFDSVQLSLVPSASPTPPSASLTVVVYDCPEHSVAFLADQDTVVIRAFTFLQKDPRIQIYDPKTRIRGLLTASEKFQITTFSSDQIFELNSTDGCLYMNTNLVKMESSNQTFTVAIDLVSNLVVKSSMTLHVVAWAENRFNPVFTSGCQSGGKVLAVENTGTTCKATGFCQKLATFTVTDHDGDVVNFDSLEMVLPKGNSDLLSLFEYNNLELRQNRIAMEDDLLKWANQAGSKGFMLLRINVKDRTGSVDSKLGSCTLRIDLPDLTGVSLVPTFISPSLDVTQTSVKVLPTHSSSSAPVFRALAIDWLRVKLQHPLPSDEIIYSISPPSSPFQIDSNGNIGLRQGQNVTGIALTIIAKFKNGSPASINRSIQIEVVGTDPTPLISSFLIDNVFDNPQGIISYLASLTFTADISNFSQDIDCHLVDNLTVPSRNSHKSSSPVSVSCIPTSANSAKVRMESSAPSLAMSVDYSFDRRLHVLVSIRKQTQATIQIPVIDDNRNPPRDLATTDVHLPDDVSAGIPLLAVTLFDADLQVNRGISCMAEVTCSALNLQYVDQGEGAGYVVKLTGSELPQGVGGTCHVIATDSIWTPDSSSCKQSSSAFQSVPESKIYVDAQPHSPAQSAVVCPMAINQVSTSTGCILQVASPASWPANYRMSVVDPTGTFGADPETGVLSFNQPLIFSTAEPFVKFDIVLGVFNGRFYSENQAVLTVANSYVSRPRFEQLLDFSPAPSSADFKQNSDGMQILEIMLPGEFSKNSKVVTIQLSGNSSLDAIRTRLASKCRSQCRLKNRVDSPVNLLLFGPNAANYLLTSVNSSNWVLQYNGNDGPRSLVGEKVYLGATYTTSLGGYDDRVLRIGSSAEITFTEQTGNRSQTGLAWYWILLIILAILIIMLLLLLLCCLLCKRRRKQKEAIAVSTATANGAYDLSGSPVKFRQGVLPASTESEPRISARSLDSMIGRRLQLADLEMTSPSTSRRGNAIVDDDGLDEVTVSSGFTDAPINLNMLNQLGPQYSNVAETCGVSKRV